MSRTMSGVMPAVTRTRLMCALLPALLATPLLTACGDSSDDGGAGAEGDFLAHGVDASRAGSTSRSTRPCCG